MSKVYTKKKLTDMISKTYSCNILLNKALIISFYLTSSSVVYAAPCTTQVGVQNILSASGGLQCETNASNFTGANVVTVVDDGSSITFTAPVTTINSNYSASTTALGINGIYRSGTAGATVNANNLIVYSGFGQNSSAIYIAGSDVNKPDTLNVTGDLTLYGQASQGGAALRSGGSGTLVKVSGLTSITTTNQDAIRNAGDMFFNNVSLTMNNGGRAIVNTKNISIDGDLTVNANNGLLINQDGGSLSIGGVTALNKTGTGTAINNINNSLIFFNDNVTLVNSTTAINNNSSEINFFGLVNNLKGNVNNLNNGLINLSNGQLGGQLTIDGDYVGTNAVFSIDTKLNDDSSVTDKLIISGNATGSTELKVNNVGGNGAQTINGIHVIQTGSSEANAFFLANGGYVSAGAYDYGLNLKGADWYLESHRRNKSTDIPVYTPDIGSYLAVETMGNTLFTSRIEDREGASQYQNLGNKNEGNVWIRAYGGHNKFTTMDSQLKTTGNSFVTQIGAGLVTLGEEDQYNLGAMTGFATYDGKTHSNLTDRGSKTEINGYSLGLYGTWYAHPVEKRGAYIDTWVLWNKFNNKIDTPDQNHYKYDSSGITASIEVGGDYLINKNGKKNWWIQPQSQVIYQGVHADDFKDAQGVDIYHGKDNVQARMGVKTYLNIPTSGNKITSYRPYVALNFIHNTSPYSVVIDDVRYENQGSANLGEIKVGVEGHITNNSQVWLNASYVAGSHDNEVYQGNIGWKYNF